MTEYTFTFNPDEEGKFRRCIDRLDPDEFKIIKEIYLVKPEDPRYSDRETVMEMDPEAALTFRLGMKNVKIRRARTEEELAEEKRIDDMNTVRITVKVDGMNPDGTFSDPSVATPE